MSIGIAYPPTALFVLGSLFILIVLLHYSTVISRLSDQNRILAQRLALPSRANAAVRVAANRTLTGPHPSGCSTACGPRA